MLFLLECYLVTLERICFFVFQSNNYIFFPTDMTIMDPLNVGTRQGIMTVEVTVNVKGKGHQVMATIIMEAGTTVCFVIHVHVHLITDRVFSILHTTFTEAGTLKFM